MRVGADDMQSMSLREFSAALLFVLNIRRFQWNTSTGDHEIKKKLYYRGLSSACCQDAALT
jgi:hypothetical protein